MRLATRAILTAALGVSLLQLTACNQTTSPARAKPRATEAVAEAPLPDVAAPVVETGPGDDINVDPTLPALPPATKEESRPSGPGFDPIGNRTPIGSRPAFEGPSLPKTGQPTQAAEQNVPELPMPKAGVEAPGLKPQLVTLTWVGGAGSQWIQDVGFTPDGKIYATSGGGGFTAYYSGDGTKKLRVEGDLAKPSSGPRGPNVSTRGTGAFRATCPTTKVQLEIGMESFGPVRTQPYLTSSADWKWWGWKATDMGKGLESSARGIRVHWLHDERFLAKVFVDSGKTTVARDPNDLTKVNGALAAGALRDPAGPGTLYVVGRQRTGTSEYASFVKGKVLAEALDPWERLYVGQYWDAKGAQDAFKLGGVAGIAVLNSNLTNPLFTGSLGADQIYCMALKGNFLVVGGSIGATVEPDPKVKTKNLVPQRLPVRNPAQDTPGGDEDGFLAIIRLW